MKIEKKHKRSEASSTRATRTTRSRKTLGYRLQSVGMGVLFLLGIAMIFNRPLRNLLIKQNADKFVVSKVSALEIKENQKAEVSYDFDAVKPISSESIIQAQVDQMTYSGPSGRFESSTYGLPVIGGIAIPELRMNLAIFKGLGNTELSYGAGTMKPDQVMGQGNYSLASHHVFGMAGSADMLFSPLARAQHGMRIYITDKDKVYTYVIDEIMTVGPNDGHVIDDVPGETEITLVTCTDNAATGRIIVKGAYEGVQPLAEADKSIQDLFV